MKDKNNKKLISLLGSDKLRFVLIIIGLMAVVLIFISSLNSDKNKDGADYKAQFSIADYNNQLTSELVSMIKSIDGVGDVKVLLTLDSSYEYVYLEDNKTLSKILEPKIRGVAVACTGGDNPVITEKIVALLRTVLSVNADKISISKLT